MGDEGAGEGTGPEMERFRVLPLVGSLVGEESLACLEETAPLVLASVRVGVAVLVLGGEAAETVAEAAAAAAAAAAESLEGGRPLRPERGISRGGGGGLGSGSGDAPRSRPLVLVEVALLSLGFRPRRAGVTTGVSTEAGGDDMSSSEEALCFRPSSLAWSSPFRAASTCSWGQGELGLYWLKRTTWISNASHQA